MMSDNKILSEMSYQAEQGTLSFSEVRYLFIRPETLAAMQKAMEIEIGPNKAGEILYAGGFSGGRLSGQKYKEDFNLNDQEAVEYMCRMGGEIGWGAMQLETLDSSKQAMSARVSHSPFAAAYGESAVGVCHLIRGVFGGLGNGIFGVEVRAEELECVAKGDDSCLIKINAISG